MNELNKSILKFFLVLVIIFFSFYGYSSTLTDSVIEPVEPVGTNETFLLRVTSTFDGNTWGEPQLVESFESDTVGGNAASWFFKEDSGLGCGGLNDTVFESGLSQAPAITNLYCPLGNQCMEFRTSSTCGGTDTAAVVVCHSKLSGSVGTSNVYCTPITYNLTASGGVASSFQDVNFLMASTDLNFTVFQDNGGYQAVHGRFWKTDQTFQMNDRVLMDINGAFGGTNRWLYVDNIRVSSIQTTSETVQATCTASFNGGAFTAMTYSAANSWNYINFNSPLVVGDYNTAIACSYVDPSSGSTIYGYNEFTITVARPERQYLTFTPIENIGSWSYGSIDINPSIEKNQLIWRIDSNSIFSEIPTFKINNSRLDGRQYFIYTATADQYALGNWVFDDTLTYGSDETNPIQKIWSETAEKYVYSFSDTLSPSETKYYKLTYRAPHKHYYSISGSDDWFNSLDPNVISDLNSITFDEYSISQYANIRSIFIDEVPNVFEDETSAFELQFTAWADVNATIIEAGQTVNGADSTTQVTLTSTPHRFSFTIDASNYNSQMLIVNASSTSANIYITDYAIIPRAYFTKRLELRQGNGDILKSILFGGNSTQYLQEGRQFRVNSQAYDREGTLEKMVLEALLDGTGANNVVKKATFEIRKTNILGTSEYLDPEDYFNFDGLFPAIIDLNGNAHNPNPPRNLIVEANIYDQNGVQVAVQSVPVKFLQYPYFANDLVMNFYPTEKRQGKNPAGVLQVFISEPQVLEGFDIRVYSDTNTVTAPNYQTKIYKGKDFNCLGSNCNLQLKLSEYLFEDTNLTTITIFSLLNTEYLNADNNLTRVDRRFFVSPITFETIKIYQTRERTDRTYRADEDIELVLILKDSEVSDLAGKIKTYITLQNCDAATAGNCVDQTLRYYPSSHVYDDKYGVNFYYFRQLFILDNGSTLPDGNYIGFRASVSDDSGSRTSDVAVLADRCQSQNYKVTYVDLLTNPIGLISYLFDTTAALALNAISGCDAGSEQFNKVTTTENSAQERRLLIDADHSLSSPTHELFMCVAPDNNAVLDKPLEQNIVCAAWFDVNEKQIDDFRLRISNQNSDFSVEGSTKEYKEFNVPYEIIAYNDPQLMKAELEADGTTINSIGDFFYYGLKSVAKGFFVSSGLQDKTNFLAGNGLIKNFGADVDFTADFNNASVSGVLFYVIKGIPVINKQDYRNDSRLETDVDLIDSKSFLNYLAEKDISVPVKKSTVEILNSEFSRTTSFTDAEGSLVIDEKPTNQNIDPNNLDANKSSKFKTIPNWLTFTVSSTMFFNNFSESETRSLVITVATVIKDTLGNSAIDFLNNFVENPVDTFGDWLFGGIIVISVLFGLLFVISRIYNNFAGGGSQGSGN